MRPFALGSRERCAAWSRRQPRRLGSRRWGAATILPLRCSNEPPRVQHDWAAPVLGNLVRIAIALSAIAPLSISVAYVFAVKDQNLRWAFIAFCCCLLMGALALWIVENARARLERLAITIKKAKSAHKDVIGFFVAYALPLR